MKLIVDIIKGIIVGIANIIPGVSGGTMMISMGIYEKVISAVNNLFKDFKKSVLTLFPLGIGLVLGIVAFSFVIPYCLEEYPFPTSLCFIGLIMGGTPSVIAPAKESLRKEKKSIGIPHIISFVVWLGITVGMAAINETETNSASFELSVGFAIILFIVGIVAAATIVIPGVSGTLVLMVLGFYTGIMDSISGFIKAVFALDFSLIWYNTGILVPFGLGVVAGVFAVAKLIEWLLAKYPSVTYSGILGLVAASPFAILMKMGHNNINPVTVIIGIVLLVAGTWFTYWFAKKTEGVE